MKKNICQNFLGPLKLSFIVKCLLHQVRENAKDGGICDYLIYFNQGDIWRYLYQWENVNDGGICDYSIYFNQGDVWRYLYQWDTSYLEWNLFWLVE